jgi:chromosome segregation ATPase
MDSSLQVRQMGLGEQLQSLREEIARIESKIDENRRSSKLVGQQLDVSTIETRENLVQLNHDYQKRFETVDGNASRLAGAIEDLQKNLTTLNDNLRTMSEFEKKQEQKIVQMHSQLDRKIGVVVEEVGRENTRLQGEITALNRDLIQLQEIVNTLDGEIRGLDATIRGLDARIRDVALRQESYSAPSSGGGGGGEHVVQKGETLSLIAKRYGVTVDAIMAANGLPNANIIRVGQALVIP